jgi:hypothetical protein
MPGDKAPPSIVAQSIHPNASLIVDSPVSYGGVEEPARLHWHFRAPAHGNDPESEHPGSDMAFLRQIRVANAIYVTFSCGNHLGTYAVRDFKSAFLPMFPFAGCGIIRLSLEREPSWC